MPWHYSPDLDAFTIYHKRQQELAAEDGDDALSLSEAFGHALAGSAGTLIVNSLLYPLDLVITRLQVQKKKSASTEKSSGDSDDSQYDGIQDAARKIYKNEGGLAAFYSGLPSDTVKSVADSFLFFFFYNSFQSAHRNWARGRKRSSALLTFDDIAVGVVAGALTKAITSPIQQVVTKKQTTALSSASSSKDRKPHELGRELSAIEIMKELYHKKGLGGFWAGYSATLILTLNPSLTFFTDSALRRLSRVGDDPHPAATFLIAATSKAFASTIMYPVSLAKTRAQAAASNDKQTASKGPGGVVMEIPKMAREGGIASLYAGLPGEVMKGFFSHGLTMLVKQRIHTLVIKLYFLLVQISKKLKSK